MFGPDLAQEAATEVQELPNCKFVNTFYLIRWQGVDYPAYRIYSQRVAVVRKSFCMESGSAGEETAQTPASNSHLLRISTARKLECPKKY